MTSIVYDLRHACRRLINKPGFSLATVLLLAIGIGGTTLVFSVVNAVLLRTLPVAAPERLARILVLTHNRPPVSEYPFSIFEQWRRRSRSFSGTFAQTDIDIAYSDVLGSRPVRAQIVTGSYYSVLGVEPFLGRLLTQRDEWAGGGDLPVILSYHFWEQRFRRDPSVLGRTVHLAGRPFSVVGVTRPEFNGISVDSGPDLQVSFIAGEFLTVWGTKNADPRRCCLWEIAGRLRSDVPLGQAQAETSAAMQSAWEAVYSGRKPLSEEDRKWIHRQRLQVEPINRGVSWLRQKFSTGLMALLGAALLLLVLACANVAGLLLAQAAAQEQYNAIRLAIGASRARLMQQWLAEGAVLALAGGAAALLITWVCLPLVNGVLPPIRGLDTRQLPAILHVPLDFRVFACVLLLCCGSTIAAAISPAWHAAHADLLTPIKSANSSRRNTRVRLFMVAAQVAVCAMVVADSGLLVETLRNLESMNPGFRRDHVITFSVDTGMQKYDGSQTSALASRLLLDTRNLPGVAAASVAVKPLLRGAGMRMSITPIAGKRSAQEDLNSDSNVVTPGYFETLGMRLIAGRVFTDRDLAAHVPAPVVVNETFARTFFPGKNAVGRYFDWANDGALTPRFEIAGIVADAKYRSLREAAFPALFTCLRTPDDFPPAPFQLLVRTFGEPKPIVASVEQILHRIDPDLPFREIHTLSEDIDASLWAEHTLARLGLLFAALATLLAAIGLFGLLSYIVVERSKEIGVRMALGARRGDIVEVAALPTLKLVAVGIGLGLAGSAGTAVLLRSLLFAVLPWNVETQVATAAILMICAAAATFGPLARAVRLDPSEALRHS